MNVALGHSWVLSKPMLLLNLLDHSFAFPALAGVINSAFWTWSWHCCPLQVNIPTKWRSVTGFFGKKSYLLMGINMTVCLLLNFLKLSAKFKIVYKFDVWLTVHCSSIQNKKPTRCHLVYVSFYLSIAQHVSGHHVPIFRSWQLSGIFCPLWCSAGTAYTVTGI